MQKKHISAAGRALADSLVTHRWLFGLTAAYITICVAMVARVGKIDALDFTMYGHILPTAIVMMLAVACIRALVLLLRTRPARPALFLVQDIRAFLSLERIATALPIFLTVPPFMAVFTSMKNLIPILNPYHWDPALAVLDRAVHGGTDPWRLLQPLVGHVWTTAALGWLYQLWFLFIFGAWFIYAFSTSRSRLRMQYFLAAILVWGCIGTFAAAALSSGGPVFYGRLVAGPDPFAPLMTYLRGVHALTPLYALDIQDMLWKTYVDGHQAIGSGISAMPSIHVATTLLFALLLRGWNRILGYLGFAFLGGIMIGSVHLGWHYAIDGYVSIAMTLVLWRVAGWITDHMREFAEPAPAHFGQAVPA